ncbi:hypothetical protein LCGC14_0705320 [marine sediment metagenome]|uniref:Uncharacterized protein n=1 Tax=marine sediment metagenome TaxID=412755 RepID=A0A0F9QL88_9ZZZZ
MTINNKYKLSRIFGIGASTSIKLEKCGITTIRQLAEADFSVLDSVKGIPKKKIIELGGVSKLYIDEYLRDGLESAVESCFKEEGFTVVQDKGKYRKFFKDLDMLALKQEVITKNKGVITGLIIRLFDINRPLSINGPKIDIILNDKDFDITCDTEKIINSNLFRLGRARLRVFEDLTSEGVLFQSLNENTGKPLQIVKSLLGSSGYIHKDGVYYKIVLFDILLCFSRIVSEDSLTILPFHKRSSSYLLNYKKVYYLIDYLREKTKLFEKFSNNFPSFSKYVILRKRFMSSILFFINFVVSLGLIKLITMQGVMQNILFLAVFLGTIGFGFATILFFTKLRRVKSSIKRRSRFPYYPRDLDGEKINKYLTSLGYNEVFRKQFLAEHT